MTTSQTSRTSPTPEPLRLGLADRFGHGPLDGGWWPRSRDLSVEAADLVDQFPEVRGRIDRLVYSRPVWSTLEHRVTGARGSVKLESFPRDDTHTMVLILASGRTLRLMVVPADTQPGLAAAMLRTAGAEGNSYDADAILRAIG